MLTDKYTVQLHIDRFSKLAEILSGSTQRCIFSFVDLYKKISAPMTALGIIEISEAEKLELTKGLSESARSAGIALSTCAEGIDLEQYGVSHGKCIDGRRYPYMNMRMSAPREDREIRHVRKGALEGRRATSAVRMRPTHRYRSVRHVSRSVPVHFASLRDASRYCYATKTNEALKRNLERRDVLSPMLCDTVGKTDCVTERKTEILRKMVDQMLLFQL